MPVDPRTGNNLAYDNELLDLHYVAGDGGVNENVGLTAVQVLFAIPSTIACLPRPRGIDPGPA